jgi:hypothetical protein
VFIPVLVEEEVETVLLRAAHRTTAARGGVVSAWPNGISDQPSGNLATGKNQNIRFGIVQ